MNSQKRTENLRKDMAGIFAILLGLAIGLFIRRVKVGLLIGIVLGFIAISLFRRK
ncbi:MAG TPA: hypothetical protein VGI82_13135 [Chitinophagaceae bacterium]|jgi:hypothetical protein